MKILICGINFTPELTGIGKYTGEMAVYLAAQGHQVRVVTAPPYYPQWRLRQDYNGLQYRRDNIDGVEVYRCPLWVPRNPSGVKRLIHLGSYALSSIPSLLIQVKWRPDVVLSVAPALANAPFVLCLTRLTGAKAWLHIQDFEVDAAMSLGLLPADSIVMRAFSRFERWLLGRFDVVSTISPRMMDRLLQKGVSSKQTQLLPNWVDTQKIYPVFGKENEFRKQLGISTDKVVALYSGNMGRKQGLEHLIAAARQLQKRDDILFVLCGEGAVKAELLTQARDLSNVRFLPLQPEKRLNELLNMADIHLLPQQADVADLVMPSKLTGMMASGRPVIATALPKTQVSNVVTGSGIVVIPGDVSGLAEAIKRMVSRPDERHNFGKAAREYAENHFSKEKILAHFEKVLLEITGLGRTK